MVTFLIRNKDGELFRPTRKTKVWPLVAHELRESGPLYIRVTYGNGLYNHCTISSKKQAQEFINTCTEEPLLKHISEGSWK